MKHIFGPVNSRRLGRSLGIDLLAEKICNLNCIYCEVGPTTLLTSERREYVDTKTIIAEIREFCAAPRALAQVDVITVTAGGEPTLHAGLGEVIAFLKETTDKPVAVLTNGTTLMQPEVCAALHLADLVIPSLDSARPASFRKVNRPAPDLELEAIISGLCEFSQSFPGRIWLEILFVRGINDAPEDIAALAEVIARLKVERIQLNTVARPPLEAFARPVEPARLRQIAAIFAAIAQAPIIELLTECPAPGPDLATTLKKTPDHPRILEEILATLKRRPCTAADLNRIFLLGGPDKVEQLLEPLVLSGSVEKRAHGDHIYYH